MFVVSGAAFGISLLAKVPAFGPFAVCVCFAVPSDARFYVFQSQGGAQTN